MRIHYALRCAGDVSAGTSVRASGPPPRGMMYIGRWTPCPVASDIPTIMDASSVARLSGLARLPGLHRCESGLDMARRISCCQDRCDPTIGRDHVGRSAGKDATASPDQDVVSPRNIPFGVGSNREPVAAFQPRELALRLDRIG